MMCEDCACGEEKEETLSTDDISVSFPAVFPLFRGADGFPAFFRFLGM